MKSAMLFALAVAFAGTTACAHGYEFKGSDEPSCAGSLFDDATCPDDDQNVIQDMRLDGSDTTVDSTTTMITGCDA